MKTQHGIKILAASLAAGSSLLLAGCHGGSNSSTGGGQSLTGTPIAATTTPSLFSSNSCLTGVVKFNGNSQWYLSGSIDLTNSCASDQSLSGQTISLTSQDSSGKAVAIGTLNNWQINSTGYKLTFSAGNANQQIGLVTADNNNPIIKVNQTISFSGGLNLTGAVFNSTLATSSFAINGASPTPTPTPTPTPSPTITPTPTPTPSPTPTPGQYKIYPDGRGSYVDGSLVLGHDDKQLYKCTVAGWCNNTSEWAYAPGSGSAWSSAWSLVSTPTPTPTPTPTTGSLSVVVNTSNTGCTGTSICNGLSVTVTTSTGIYVTSFIVPTAALGGSYTQEITGLTGGSKYTVAGTSISSTTVTYTPSATPTIVSGSVTPVTIKYDKTSPVITTGGATVSLANVVPTYTGDLQVKVFNTKAVDPFVNSYTVKQGGSFATGDLPITDSTHAYVVQMTTGIADPVLGTYYIESGLPSLTITAGNTTSLAIPMVASPTTVRHNATVAVSGLSTGNTVSTVFSDAASKYSYVNTTGKSNGSTVYKIESGLNLGVTVQASGSNYEVNPITSTGVVTAAKTITAGFKVQVTPTPTPTPTPSADKVVTVYLLIDSPAQLKQYTDDLARVSKVNFNRVIFSFVKPTLSNYVSGSLANTGIMDYFNAGDGQGVAAFNQLKQAVALSKAKNIQAFLSVGGWNYSCNFAVYGTSCGDAETPTNGIHYDWFPDPSDSTQAALAKTSYDNVIKLTNDLGMQGIDLDAEEFWHADKYAVQWKPGSTGEWSTDIAKSVNAAGGPTYANLVQYGGGTTTSSGPAIMPKTVDKMAAIMHALEDNPNAKDLMFSTAAPPVGARPITGFVYGDNAADIYTKGGVWWLGNLKGLWYNLTDKDKAIVDRFDSIGLMTYDLCGDNATTCAPYGGGPLDLPGQVGAYMKDYTNWLKSSAPSAASLSVDPNGKVAFLPAKYNISSKIQFGFEVNQPAYPRNASGQLQLTNALVDTIAAQQKDSGGVIIWQMYSKQNTAANGTTSKYTMNQSCKTFLASDTRYDCNADFPSAAK